ncbi:YbjN domain-containing protein [Brevundimonas halotolerans]|uniref:YbjN domain-containing protein n=1 Tax=Brevundimonas halotolerans TaxID=69670 RepID=A0A7W9A2C0_9CAUL|nr:YbjN domain-containing protein [Brevundimonas halotolerans]MBB5660138.1 hypothetical protein [Brevundimonas halotolerans]
MDMVRPDEVETAFDPLDVVEHVLTAENLPFDRTAEGDLAFALAGDWKDYELWFAWRPEGDCLQLCCALDLRVGKTRRPALHELIGLINQRTWLGHFELWSEDQEIVFRHALALPHGERPTLSQAASMIDAAIDAADRYFPAFDYLVRGGRKPQDAIDACMFQTVGTA